MNKLMRLLIVFLCFFVFSAGTAGIYSIESIRDSKKEEPSTSAESSGENNHFYVANPHYIDVENDTTVLALSSRFFPEFGDITVPLYEVNKTTPAGINIYDFITMLDNEQKLLRYVWTALILPGSSIMDTTLILKNQGSGTYMSLYFKSFAGVALIRMDEEYIVPILIYFARDNMAEPFNNYFIGTGASVKMIYDDKEEEKELMMMDDTDHTLISFDNSYYNSSSIQEIRVNNHYLLHNGKIIESYEELEDPVQDSVKQFLEDNSYPSSGTTPE